MRLRRRHRDDWPLPSGLAEVELFRFWEADLADTLPPEVLAVRPPDTARSGTPAAGPDGEPPPSDPPPDPPADPLWWAAGLVFVVVLAVLVV